mmetsp:Transcript_17198/g.41410  ORF Transcript_17198/g.41410 Transcript_17198/m.41410 type:complete len:281 (+) Transcript_17198:61-903(+)
MHRRRNPRILHRLGTARVVGRRASQCTESPHASRASQASTPAIPAFRTASEQRACWKDARAHAPSVSSSIPSVCRHTSNSERSEQPKRRGSSALMVHVTPCANSLGRGCASSDGTTLRRKLLVGQTSRHTPLVAIRATSGASGAASTPCPTRAAPRTSTQNATLRGPEARSPGAISPACGMALTGESPPHAISKARANGSGGFPSSSACSPNPTRAWGRVGRSASASVRTARASASASAGDSWRAAEMMNPIPIPCSSSTSFDRRSRSLSVAASPPKSGA